MPLCIQINALTEDLKKRDERQDLDLAANDSGVFAFHQLNPLSDLVLILRKPTVTICYFILEVENMKIINRMY